MEAEATRARGSARVAPELGEVKAAAEGLGESNDDTQETQQGENTHRRVHCSSTHTMMRVRDARERVALLEMCVARAPEATAPSR